MIGDGTSTTRLFYNMAIEIIIETHEIGIEYPFSGDELRKVCYNKNMSNTKNAKCSILESLIASGDIYLVGTTFIGRASDGVEVAICEDTENGHILAERYLTDYPTPDTW